MPGLMSASPLRLVSVLAYLVCALPFAIAQPLWECDVCKGLVDVLDFGIKHNLPVADVEALATDACMKFGVYGGSKEVCGGAVDEFTPELMYILSTGKVAAATMCETLGACEPDLAFNANTRSADASADAENAVDDEVVSRVAARWKATREARRQREGLFLMDKWFSSGGSKGSELGTFVQITDVHYDANYTVGANTQCGRPQCCRAEDGPGTNTSNSAGKWGDYSCDTPPSVLQSLGEALQTLSKGNPAPDFVLWTGDDPPHDVWMQSRAENLQAAETVSQMLHSYLPDTAIFPCVGNHEAFPVNQFAGPYAHGSFSNDDWLLDALAEYWAPFLNRESLSNFTYAGYYTQLIHPGLRLVSLNTNLGANGNFWLLLNDTDYAEQLQWLEATLEESEAIGEKVFIIGHHPFGDPGVEYNYSDALNAMVEKYQTTVAGIFGGHTHHDQFQVMRDTTNTNPITTIWVAPSVTPYTQQNPAFRVYLYNRTTNEVLDYVQYVLNIEKANANDKAVWEVAYQMRAEYGLASLQATEMQALIDRMAINSTVFDTYASNYNAGVPYLCTTGCVHELMCEVNSATSRLLHNCQQVSQRWVERTYSC